MLLEKDPAFAETVCRPLAPSALETWQNILEVARLAGGRNFKGGFGGSAVYHEYFTRDECEPLKKARVGVLALREQLEDAGVEDGVLDITVNGVRGRDTALGLMLHSTPHRHTRREIRKVLRRRSGIDVGSDKSDSLFFIPLGEGSRDSVEDASRAVGGKFRFPFSLKTSGLWLRYPEASDLELIREESGGKIRPRTVNQSAELQTRLEGDPRWPELDSGELPIMGEAVRIGTLSVPHLIEILGEDEATVRKKLARLVKKGLLRSLARDEVFKLIPPSVDGP